jgi:hypothetical protein
MIEANEELWEGEEITLRGRKYILPPLNFAGLAKFRKRLNSVAELDADAQAELFFEIVLWCFHRNYPSMTMADLKEMADLKNFGRMRDIALQTSRFSKVGGSTVPGKEAADLPQI